MTATLPTIGLTAGTDMLRRDVEPMEPDDSAEGSEANRPFASIVVPYYNPGDRLRPTIEQLMCVLDASGMSFEIITVSDGSTDGSPHTLEEFPESVVRVSYATNVGKGHALRTGLGMARGRYVGFIDADGDISPEFLASFVSIMHAEEPDIVIGSKRHPDSLVHWTPLRRLYSWGHQYLTRSLFRLNVKDTQVGIKLADRRVVADVLPLLRESRFALDLELLVLAKRLGYGRIVEAPVRIEQRARQHDLAEARLAAACRHPRPLRPLVGPPRVRHRHRSPFRRGRAGCTGRPDRDHGEGSRPEQGPRLAGRLRGRVPSAGSLLSAPEGSEAIT